MNLTLAELEAMTWFLQDRYHLWCVQSKAFGVTDPDNAPKELAKLHARRVAENIELSR